MNRHSMFAVPVCALLMFHAGASPAVGIQDPVIEGTPVQLVVRGAMGKCSATLAPEGTDLRTLLPTARDVHKVGLQSGLLYQSCEVWVPKADFLDQFAYCALASAPPGGICHVSFAGAGGRQVEFSAISRGARKPVAATCTFVCVRQ